MDTQMSDEKLLKFISNDFKLHEIEEAIRIKLSEKARNLTENLINGLSDSSALYLIIRNGSVEVLELFFELKSKSFDDFVDLISVVFEELAVKRVAISNRMNYFIQSAIIKNRAFNTAQCSLKNSMNDDTKDRMIFLKGLLQLLCQPGTAGEVTDETLAIVKFIGINIKVLKFGLSGSDNIIPWEELEFCVTIFLSFNMQTRKNEMTYDECYGMVLSKERFFWHMENFLKNFDKLNETFVVSPSIKNRKDMIELLYKNYDGYKELLTDIDLLRNISTLNRILFYIKIACDTDFDNENVSVMVVQRSLQVVGEYLKKISKESTKLSKEIYSKINVLTSAKIKNLIDNIRDDLSHAFTLEKRYQLEQNDINFFRELKEDLKLLISTVSYQLSMVKMRVLQKFLKRNIHSDQKINDLIPNFANTINVNFWFSSPLREIIIELKATALTESQKYMIKDIEYNLNYINNLGQTDPRNTDPMMVYDTMEYFLKQIDTFIAEKDEPLENLTKAITTFLRSFKGNDNNQIPEKLIQKLDQLEEEMFVAFYKSSATSKLTYELEQITSNETLESMASDSLRRFIDLFPPDSDAGRNLRVNIDRISGDWKFLNEVIENNTNDYDKDKMDKIMLQLGRPKGKKGKEVTVSNLERMAPNLPYDVFVKNCDPNSKKTVDKYEAIEKLLLQLNLIDDQNVIKSKIQQLKYLDQKVEFQFFDKQKATLQKMIDDFVTTENCNSQQFKSQLFPAIEMVVLNMLEFLTRFTNFAGDKNFLDTFSPIPTCRSLRNYLAHGDAFIDVILPSSLIANAKILIDLNLDEQFPLLIGSPLENCVADIKERFEQNMKWIKEQQSLLEASRNVSLSEIGKSILSNGGDLRGTDLGRLTAMHYILQDFNLENNLFIKYLLNRINGTSSLTLPENLIVQLDYIFHECKKCVEKIESPDFIKDKKIKYINQILISSNVNEQKEAFVSLTVIHEALEIFHEIQIDGNCNLKDCLQLALMEQKNILADAILTKTKGKFLADTEIMTKILHSAVKYNNYKGVQLLTEVGIPNINAIQDGVSTLHLATGIGSLEILKLLMENNSRSDAVPSLVYVAAKFGRLEIFKFLIEEKGYPVITEGEDTPLIIALIFKQMNIVQFLLLTKPDLVNIPDCDGVSPLHFAIKFSCADFVLKLLIEKGANLNAIDLKSRTPLHYAIFTGKCSLIEILLKDGALIDGAVPKTPTPLHYAVGNNQLAIVKKLLEHRPMLNINAEDHSHRTPLHEAANNDLWEIASVLIANGANINAVIDNEMGTPLTLACLMGAEKMVELLLKYEETVVNNPPNTNSPIHLASFNGNLKIVEMLIKKNADLSLQNHKGFTPLHYACYDNNFKVVKKLIQQRVDVNAEIFSDYMTPLIIAIQHGFPQIVKFLLKNKANFNSSGENVKSPLHYAVAVKQVDIVKMLLKKKGIDLEASDDDFLRPLYIAVMCHHFGISQMLVDKGADINSLNSPKNQTPLQLAASNSNNCKILKMFIGKMKKIISSESVSTYLGEALHFAVKNQCHENVQILLENGANVAVKKNSFTSIQLAAIAGNEKIFSCLLEVCSDCDLDNIDGKLTPLAIAVFRGHLNIVKFLMEKKNYQLSDLENIFRNVILSNHLKIVEQMTSENKNNDHLEIIHLLIDNSKSDDDEKSQELAKLIMMSATLGHANIVKLLLEKKINNHNVDESLILPLQAVAFRGNLEIVKIFLERKGLLELEKTLKTRFTAIQCAAIDNHTEIVQFLIENGAEQGDLDKNFGKDEFAEYIEQIITSFSYFGQDP